MVAASDRAATQRHRGTALAHNQAPADQTLYAKDKRQSRALRSNFISRMGLDASPSGSTLTLRGRASSRDCAVATEGLTIGANPGPPPRPGSRASAAD